MIVTEHGFSYRDRDDWGAAHGQGSPRRRGQVVDLLVVHHSWRPALACGRERAQERALMRSIEEFHAGQGWAGIGYHFLIFQSGNAYEGRGWKRVGSHTAGQNSRSLGVCFVMDGDSDDPTPAAVEAFREFQHAAEQTELASDYLLRGHRDFSSKTCPGDRIYRAIVEASMVENPTLREGMKGPQVERAQRLLQHVYPQLRVDGDFGPRTAALVKEFQEREGLTADGVIDPATWEALRT